MGVVGGILGWFVSHESERLERRTKESVEASEKRVNDRFDSLERSVNDKFDALDKKLEKLTQVQKKGWW